MESNVGKKLKLSDIELLDRTVIDDDSLKKMLIESFNPNGIPFGVGVVWWYTKNNSNDEVSFNKRATQTTDEDLELAIKFAEESEDFLGWSKSLQQV